MSRKLPTRGSPREVGGGVPGEFDIPEWVLPEIDEFASAAGRSPEVFQYTFRKGLQECVPVAQEGGRTWTPEQREADELDQRIMAGWAAIRREYPPSWKLWLEHRALALQKAASEERARRDRLTLCPWKGRTGWEEEPTLPEITEERKGPGGTNVEVAVEPGIPLYNRLVTGLHYRPFRTVNGGVRIAVPGKRGLEVYDPEDSRKGPEGTETDLVAILGYELFTLHGRPIPYKDLRVAVSTLTQRARSRELPRERIVRLALRVAAEGGVSRLDLLDDDRRCVVVSADGWSIEANGRPTFDQRMSMRPLPEPRRADGPDGWRRFQALWKAVLIPPPTDYDDPRLLATALLVHFLLRPDSPKPIGLFGGDEGSGKSTAARLFQSVLDPASPAMVGARKLEDPKELVNMVMNHAVVNVDNVSNISPELSDELARLSTGIGFSQRELYSDSGEVVGDVCPLILLNGITATPHAPDLLRRIAFFPVQPPFPTIPTAQLNAEFAAALPDILGGLLDLAVATARILRDDPPPLLNSSMADHVQIGQAVAKAMGRPCEDFVRAWAMNVEKQGSAAAENPWVIVLGDYFRGRSLTEGVTAEHISEWINRDHKGSFPKGVTPVQVGHAVLRVKKTLSKLGITIGRRQLHGRTLYFRLAEDPSAPRTPALDDSGASWILEGRPHPTHPTFPTPGADSSTENAEVGSPGAGVGSSSDHTLARGGDEPRPHPNPTLDPTPLSTSENPLRGGEGGVFSSKSQQEGQYSTGAGHGLPEVSDLGDTRGDRARRAWAENHPGEGA